MLSASTTRVIRLIETREATMLLLIRISVELCKDVAAIPQSRWDFPPEGISQWRTRTVILEVN